MQYLVQFTDFPSPRFRTLLLMVGTLPMLLAIAAVVFAREQLRAGLAAVTGEHYAGSHWLELCGLSRHETRDFMLIAASG